MFFLAREQPISPAEHIKFAIVETEAHRRHAQFTETTTVNVGKDLRCFFDYDEALAWLKNS